MNPFLEINDINYSYQTLQSEIPALSHISLSLRQGEFLSIVGPSGCGKSTLLNILCGLEKPDNGSVMIQGEAYSSKESNIGYMLQKDHLFEWRTVYSNITLGLEIRKQLTAEHKEKVKSMMEFYGLTDFASARPSELSGGMRQRAALIRTLALEPDLLLLDEPFSALDYQTRLEVCDDMYQIIKAQNKTAILVTHDLAEAISTGDRVIVLSARPATIRTEIPIRFEGENQTPLKRRNAKEFSQYFNQIWRVLRDEGTI